MIRTSFILAALAATAATAPAEAADAPAARYSVELLILDGRSVPLNPRLLVDQGSSATFMTSDPSHSVRIVATPFAGNRVSLDANFAFWTPAGLRSSAERFELAADGEPIEFLHDRTDPESGVARPVTYRISVRSAAD